MTKRAGSRVYVYHWALIMGDERSHEYRDGTADWDRPIDTHEEYDNLKKKLAGELAKEGKRLNIISLSFLHTRDAEKEIPIPSVLHCPGCGELHVDKGEWAHKIHKTHQCQSCGQEWRPYPVATVGIDPLSAVSAGETSNER